MIRILTRQLRFITYGLLGFIIILLLLQTGLNYLLPQSVIKPKLESEFQNFLRRKLTIRRLGWRVFPFPALVGHGVELFDKDGSIMAHSPKVRLTLSLADIFNKKLGFRSVVFIRPQGKFRRNVDGTFNIREIVRDIQAHLAYQQEKNKKPRDIRFHDFIIKKARFIIIDEKLRSEPLSVVLLIDAHGEIMGNPGMRTFPFKLFSMVEGDREKNRLDIDGVLSGQTEFQVRINEWPVSVLADYLPMVASFEGYITALGNYKRNDAGLVWDLIGSGKDFKPTIEGVFPAVDVSYDLDSEKPSELLVNLKGENSDATMTVRFPDFNQSHASINFESTKIDVGEIIEWKKTLKKLQPNLQQKTSLPTKAHGWKVDFTLNAKSATFKGEKLSTMVASGTQDRDGTLRMEMLKVNGLGGTLKSKAVIDKKDVLDISWTITDVDMGRLLDLTMSKIYFTGTGATVGHLVGPLGKEFWTKANGHVELDIQNGLIWGVPGLIKTLSVLNLKSLTSKSPVVAKDATPFDTATAKLTLKEGVVELKDPALIKNKTAEMAIMGNVDLRSKTVDARIVMNFLTVVGELINAVPGVRTVLLGGKKSIVPIWVSVKGPIQDPKVKVLAEKSITKPVWNTIGRTFRLPFTLLQSITGK